MRILVTGSRTWTDVAIIHEHLAKYFDGLVNTTLVHGDCHTGADRIADAFAVKNRWKVERFPAKWNEYGKRAGFVRNAKMVQIGADICLAFIENGSRGATMCADLAEKAGIETVRICK